MARVRMTAPLTLQEFLCRIAAETARMSYLGSMSRGKRPVVFKGAKSQLGRARRALIRSPAAEGR
jgi:hypothetical protein